MPGVTRGRFITLEGGEGTGKSTHAAALCEALERRGIDTLATREPGGAHGADEIRKLLVEGEPGRWDPVSELLLHYAARREHVVRTILPALEKGLWVVSDRFADSTLAYQGYGHGLGAEAVAHVHAVTVGDLKPDLTVILDLDPAAGLARASQRGGGEDRYERMALEFHGRLRQGFLEIAEAGPDRCVVIDAEQDVASVGAAIWRAVESRLNLP